MNQEQRKALDADIPRDQIHKKPGKNLSYIPGGWVTDQMNIIFGPDGWNMEVVEATLLPGEKINAFARVRVTVGKTVREDCACGTGYGADGYHQAVGEAVTDAFKRCCARLGRFLGGQLYLKKEDPRSLGDLDKPELPDAKKVQAAIDKAKSMATLEKTRADIRMLRSDSSYHPLIEAFKKKEEELNNG